MPDLEPWILALGLSLCLTGGCGDDADERPVPFPPLTSTGDAATAGAPSTSSPGAADGTTTDAGPCAGSRPSIVTDIDETLTLSDAEFIMQIGDGNYDPVEREGAAALIGAYAQRGYDIVYLTARSEQIEVEITDETAREATVRWLDEHGFPLDPERTTLILAPMFVLGQEVRAYKAQALQDEQAAGRRFDYAYGNATTDVEAYADAGIAVDATFIIGEHAGEAGTVAVDGEGWIAHASEHLPGVPAVCEAG